MKDLISNSMINKEYLKKILSDQFLSWVKYPTETVLLMKDVLV